MKDVLTEKLMLNSVHGMDCTVEVCKPGCPDCDELIFKGAAGDCLRYIMEYELPMDGDSYFSFTTNQDNYCGYNFEEIAFRLGFVPEKLHDILGRTQDVDELIQDASGRASVTHQRESAREMGL